MDGADHPGAHFGGPARVLLRFPACTSRGREREGQPLPLLLVVVVSTGGGLSPGSSEGGAAAGVMAMAVEWSGGAQVVLGLCQVA
uniref:Uncharacterized protein n=1 Tax=Oryza nivara TaxID=4536 RepID=A0A0E0IPU0_ORYNI